MSRLQTAFEQARADDRGVLVVYLCAGDPGMEATVSLAVAAAEAGADIIELGIPYSDPIADGPVIQAAAQRALRRGATVSGVLVAAAAIRRRIDTPVVIMSCYNPILQFGPRSFAREAAFSGVDAVLVSDLPPEESDEWVGWCKQNGLGTVLLVAPTTRPDRIEQIVQRTTGFVYAVSRPGTTGERTDLPPDLPALIESIRARTELPVVVGFGISTPDQVRSICRIADGAVVGSAVVRAIGEAPGEAEAIDACRTLVASLAEGKAH